MKNDLYNKLIFIRYIIYRYIIKHKYNSFYLHNKININPVNGRSCFFGYYNLSPINYNGDVIYLISDNNNINKPISIILKTIDGKVKKIAETRAWNWQQGCMLQWYPYGGNYILYNDIDVNNEQYITKIINKEGTIIRTYSKPVNNVSKDGTYALTLNYERLAMMRPCYGYFCRPNPKLPLDSEDGIWKIDFKTKETKLIISLESLKNLSYSPTMEGAKHKVNHIDINPFGNRFIFLHRWSGPKGRFMRLISADQDGNNIIVLNGDKMTSHSCWENDKSIISYCYVEGIGNGYFRFTDLAKRVEKVSDKLPQDDGHPSVSPNQEYLITDTYPDKSRFSSLYLYSFKKDYLIKLGEFYQPLYYKDFNRVDLHPKWSLDGNSVFLESAHSGKRNLYNIELRNILR